MKIYKVAFALLSCLIVVLFGYSSCLFAQAPDSKPKLFDAFNKINTEHTKARLDVFFQSLNENPSAKAYVIVYGSTSDCIYIENSKTKQREAKSVRPRKGAAQRKINSYRVYLVENRKLDSLRLILINGGFREKETTELWLVPPGQQPPIPSPTVNEKSVKFRKSRIKRTDILKDC